MDSGRSSITPRERAFAELARARGWVADDALDRSLERAARGESGVEQLLRSEHGLNVEQVESLWDAVDGVGEGDPTIAPPVDTDATLVPGGRPSSSDATFVPSNSPSSSRGSWTGSGSASDATMTPASAPSSGLLKSGGKRPPSSIPRTSDRFGAYKLMRELGRGGMGVVYRAMHVELRREVALKVMIESASEEDPDTKRFRQEAALVAKLGRHPNLVAVHEIGLEDGRLYFTMDFVDGKSAKQRLEDEGAFPAREAASTCADIASALEFVHKAGVLHRDVKPHNVLRDREGKALLSDFGLAKDLAGAGGMTVSGAALGTPAYMAPEIAARGAKSASPASDVYSLGATLYEMMTGRPPFEGANGIEFVRMIVETDPAAPRSINPALHPDLEVVCMKAMHKEPTRRYETAAAFEADLRRFLNGEPIVARPVGRMERLLMKARRHSGPVSAACVALALLLGTGGWWLARRIAGDRAARQAREEKEARAREAAPLLEEGRSLLERAKEAVRGSDAPLAAERSFSAERVLARAVALVPEDPEARLDHARALRMCGRWREALAELDRVTELSPRHAIAWFEHGSIALDRLWLSRSRALEMIMVNTTNDLGYRSMSTLGMTKIVRGAAEKANNSWIEVARLDFGKVMECGAAPERAAYGRAVLAYLSGDYGQAEVELADAVRADPYYVPAVTLLAEISEAKGRPRAEQIEARRRIHELEPFNSRAALDLAMLIALDNRHAEALALVDDALRTGEDPDLLTAAASIEITGGRAEAAERHARRALELQKDPLDIQATVGLLGDILSMQKRTDEALAVVDVHAAAMGEERSDTLRLEWLNNAGRFKEATRVMRKYKMTHRIYGWAGHQAAHGEWNCGNLDRAEAITTVLTGKLDSTVGVILLDRGDAKGALKAFQEHLRVRGDSPEVHSNLAGAQFLLKDYSESIRELQRGIVTSPIPDRVKDSVKPLFENLRKRAEASNSPAEAGKVVESLAGLIQLASAQSGADNATQAAANEAQRGLMFALQEFYYRNDLYEASVGAGTRYMKFAVNGNVLYKQARSLAAAGKRAGALAALAEAQEKGFDDGSRLDAEAGFESLRQDPEFKALRKACR